MAERGIQYKTRGELQAMRASGLILARAIDAGRAAVQPGATTGDVDAAVAAVIAEAGAISNFLHYGSHGRTGGFPATICASVNDEVVHGIPGRRVLVEGDLLSIDAGCVLDGWHSDSAVSVHVGSPPSMAEVDLVNATELAMWAGIAAAKPVAGWATCPGRSRCPARNPAPRMVAATARCPVTAATASARPCTWIRSSRTRASAAKVPDSLPAWPWPSNRC